MKLKEKPTDNEIMDFYENCGFRQDQWTELSNIKYCKEHGQDTYYWIGTNCSSLIVGGFVPPVDMDTLLTKVLREISDIIPGHSTSAHHTISPSKSFELLARWTLKVSKNENPALALFRVLQKEVNEWYTKKQSWMREFQQTK